MNWRAIGLGLVTLFSVAALSFLTAPSLMLLSGVCGGVLVGYVAGDLRSGLRNGSFLGLLIVVLSWLVIWGTLAIRPFALPYPTSGVLLAIGWWIAVLWGVESVLGGLIGGFARTQNR